MALCILWVSISEIVLLLESSHIATTCFFEEFLSALRLEVSNGAWVFACTACACVRVIRFLLSAGAFPSTSWATSWFSYIVPLVVHIVLGTLPFVWSSVTTVSVIVVFRLFHLYPTCIASNLSRRTGRDWSTCCNEKRIVCYMLLVFWITFFG